MAKILVVDDEAAVLCLIRQALEKREHEVLTAGCADEAIQAYLDAGEDIDLVITDLIMPGKTGLDIILELRERDVNIKILAISGGIKDTNYLPVADLLGAVAHMSKPFKPHELTDEVERLLGCNS